MFKQLSLFSLSLLIITNVHASFNKQLMIKDSSIRASESLGAIKLFRNNKGFSIEHDGLIKDVPSHCLDKQLRDMPAEKLKAFQKIGYISVKKSKDGQFDLKSHVRALGGGPMLASGVYWLTKTLCYGTAGAAVVVATATGATAAAAAGTAVASAVGISGATGAVAGGVAFVGAGGAAGTAITGATCAGGVAVAAMSATPAAMVSTAIVGAGAGQAAALGTAAVVTASGGTIAGVVAAVESFSVLMGGLAMLLPTP